LQHFFAFQELAPDRLVDGLALSSGTVTCRDAVPQLRAWGTPHGPFLCDLWKIEAFSMDQTGVSKFLDLELWWFPAGIKQFVGILRVPNS